MVITAGQLRPGAQVAEADGFLWDVAEIVRETPGTVTVRLTSDFSSMHDHWTVKPDGTPGGVIKTWRKSTRLQGILSEA